MSRRKPGARSYKFYSERQLQLCISDIENKVLTQREASAKYKIPRSSIILKLKAMKLNKVRKPGRQCIFTKEEEISFVDHAIEMCKYGFPITVFDLRCIVKLYLEKKGRIVPQFSNNLPGRTWVQCFLKRHKKELSQRLCSNIKRVRAAVNEETIKNYFNHLKVEIEGVPPHLIYNYDETNLVDDPGKKKVLTKRGTKYPEAIKNSTKAAFSLMVCGNAAGEILPPYVNYKADNMWDTWTEGGPPNTHYNRSSSGWFDMHSFEDWFFTTLLPVLRREEGKKVVIGDNLSSHISQKVIEACEKYNIAFVALPPNSTHLTQPLDVAYFRPLKLHWRKVLDEWKSTRDGQVLPTIPKNIFPSLLKRLWDSVMPRTEANLKAGFLKTGIYPTNETPVLQRLPTYRETEEEIGHVDPSLVSESFVEFLENKRNTVVGRAGTGRKKKLNVPAGKSITSEDLIIISATPATSQIKPSKKKRRAMSVDSDSDDSVNENLIELANDSDSDRTFMEELEGEDLVEFKDQENQSPNCFATTLNCESIPDENDFVLVEYEGELWPGQIQTKEADGAYVKCLTRCGRSWKWPEKEDIIFYPTHKIKFKIDTPKKMSTKRALFRVPELEDKWGKPKK